MTEYVNIGREIRDGDELNLPDNAEVTFHVEYTGQFVIPRIHVKYDPAAVSSNADYTVRMFDASDGETAEIPDSLEHETVIQKHGSQFRVLGLVQQ